MDFALPGFVRTIVERAGQSARVDWARDSARRFMPLAVPLGGLRLVEAFDLEAAKRIWLSALEDADRFCRERPPDEYGCLYYSTRQQGFVIQSVETPLAQQGVVLHFATLGGVLPRIADQSIRAESSKGRVWPGAGRGLAGASSRQ